MANDRNGSIQIETLIKEVTTPEYSEWRKVVNIVAELNIKDQIVIMPKECLKSPFKCQNHVWDWKWNQGKDKNQTLEW